MLTLVPTPIGNISDISLRAMETLFNADVLLCEDTRVTKKLLNILIERYSQERKEQQFIAVHSHNEYDFIKNLRKDFFEKNVVYVSDAGMPGISDPAQLLVRYCLDNDIAYDVLPGANAALTAFVASGFVTTEMLFYGFIPHKGSDRKRALLGAMYNGFTTVLYESPHRLIKLLEEINTEDPFRRVFLAKELTKRYQSFYSGTAKEITQQLKLHVKGEWVVVIEKADARNTTLSEQDILEFDIPKKSASKLISKITGENPKACYQRLIEN
ncbi:MAG: 16S rRNA (cytidine(1402)-2'-O)-methyltransferase [Campylobacterota bacterium]|nr:16S rRNA (cytidine(1402)-2'-O)-methyltransferase [Campylobacterota bacterium]